MGLYLGDIKLDEDPLVSQALHDQYDRAMETVISVRAAVLRRMTSLEIADSLRAELPAETFTEVRQILLSGEPS